MKRLFPIIIAFTFLATNCNNYGRQNFSLTVKHVAGGIGLTRIYNMDEQRIQVNTNCDFENCKQETVYKRSFTKGEVDSIFKFINSLQLDTLKSSYETKGMFDGLFTELSFSKGLLSTHTSTFDNFNTPVTDTLYKFIDGLIATKKYRFYSWGHDE